MPPLARRHGTVWRSSSTTRRERFRTSILTFRDHVVRGAEFFDADAHPIIAFRSTRVELGDDGSATVTGVLTIRGEARTITAHGTYHPPREDPFGSQRAGLELRTSMDRRTWDMNWQLPLPDGSDALGWDVEITAQLELIKKKD